jgi:serine/threonine protein phosphatase PrpC
LGTATISQSELPERCPARPELHPRAWVSTHRGVVRESNQDSFLIRTDAGLWMVADGVGGHAGGEGASEAIAAALRQVPFELDEDKYLRSIEEAFQTTHRRLRRQERENRGGGATTVVVLVARGDHVTCLWAGDSRAYRLRNGQLDLLTSDHSLLQEWIAAGRITAEQARNHPSRNVITRALGANSETVAVDRFVEKTRPGDIYLLCSDGLSVVLSEQEIARILSGALASTAEALVDAALDRGAPDNVTALVISLSPPVR